MKVELSFADSLFSWKFDAQMAVSCIIAKRATAVSELHRNIT